MLYARTGDYQAAAKADDSPFLKDKIVKHATKAFLLICAFSLSVNAIKFIAYNSAILSFSHFWWILPAMCVLLILGMFGLFISAMMSREGS
jgi:hypothetical protein